MPTKTPYVLGPGELYLDDTVIEISGNPELGIPDLAIESDDIREYVYEHCTGLIPKAVNTSAGLSFTATLKVDKFALYKLTGVYDWTISYCPNRRVAHLIKYGKTKRVREKNFNRAWKLLVKELIK